MWSGKEGPSFSNPNALRQNKSKCFEEPQTQSKINVFIYQVPRYKLEQSGLIKEAVLKKENK